MNQKLLRKNFFAFLIAVAFYLGAAERVNGQWVLVPDSNFAAAIAAVAPSAMSGDSMNTADPAIVNMTYLDVSGLNINDLEGIEYFTNLYSLNCKSNNLTYLPALPPALGELICRENYSLSSLPSLPNSLISLDCGNAWLFSLPQLPPALNTLTCDNNFMDSLPDLPASLEYLKCNNSGINSLPALPPSLIDLVCGDNSFTNLPALPLALQGLLCDFGYLTSLPTLPNSLSYLSCMYNQLTSLPALPNSLTQFYCEYNKLTSLPTLPSSLIDFECDDNTLTSLPTLPTSLFEMVCGHNKITILPSLPASLTSLDCTGDSLSSLPSLPYNLHHLWCSGSSLTALPILPSTLATLDCSNNFIPCLPLLPQSLQTLVDTNSLNTCLPNIPATLTSILGTKVLCDPYNSICYAYPIISGSLYDDDNLNSILDSGEIGHPNVIIQVQPGNYFFPTTDTTYYSYTLDSGVAYTIAANAIPYYNIVPASHSTPALYYGMIDSLNDFALQRIGIVHDFSIKITPNDVAWRGADMTHTLTAINNGTVIDTASVQYVYDSQLTYISSSPPAIVNGDTLQWNNINLIPGQKTNVQVTFHTSSFTPLGTNLYSNAIINPIARDTTPADNVDSLTQVVVGSYDPNEKTVDPQGAITVAAVTKGQWLDYIVRFQNTGNDTAMKVEIQDTLSSNLDLSTMQVITSSSKMTWSIRQSVAYFEFNNINLPDSGANETGSQGFVRYRLKAKSSLSPGDFINNTAYIFFDQNSPVVTNTTNTVVSFPTSINALSDDGEVLLYPNPATNQLTLEMPALKNKHVQLFIKDIVGQTVIQSVITSPKSAIDVSSLASGIYLIEIIGEKERWTRKFVKE